MENGTFSWGPDESPILKSINIRCKQGSLVAVVGTVGAGKSSLMSAFLGEMDKVTGRVNTKVNIYSIAVYGIYSNKLIPRDLLLTYLNKPGSRMPPCRTTSLSAKAWIESITTGLLMPAL